ncbi:MAG: ABC transporter permease [Defluviitaleaceae bacterium]|nr:ABC transporter permease [Defluviitaleaceae bacterium]
MRIISDSYVMFKRSMKISLRNPDAIAMAIIVPAFVMWLFGTVFGNITDVGYDNYINFIVPGIILQAVCQATTAAAITVNNDINKGIIDRFRSMPISKSAVLIGHVLASVARNTLTAAIIIGVAFIIGFRPEAFVADWLLIAAILILFMLAITWLAVICGLVAKTPESAGSMMGPLFILPFLSSGFAPTETMTGAVRWFAENQPMTPIINSTRALMLNTPTENALPLSLIWSVGIIIIAFAVAVQVYKRKLA